MYDTHASFHSVNGKRLILIVEDVELNREVLASILESSYEIIFAVDGTEALELIESHKRVLSAVILDLILPSMRGEEVLRVIKANPEYQDIPVVVASGDLTQETHCLNMGASDFIQKPYPQPQIVLARVRRAIELFEGRRIIHSTERDPLTGLYNREFFFSYAEQYDQHHKETPMDAIVLDINHFSIINERHGRAYADEVLRRVGEKARDMVHDSGGIVCRREADIFLVYCPHREDYKAILDNASKELASEQEANKRIRLRMGVYPNVDKSLDLEQRFDHAKSACDSVRNSFTNYIGFYDDKLHKANLYAERLIDDFGDAIEQGQFRVYFQPKFNIAGDEPFLAGAEGLVRWHHPELGMINPGVFIPLFENNGLIQALDYYVWREAARQIRRWKDQLGFSVPVSVNVSRVDMYDTNTLYTLLDILEENKLEAFDIHLEVTESAYAEDAEQIVDTVKRLRAMGFLVEMDDFGTGYSSLNMLSTLPIDILKLDMKFVRTAFSEGKDTQMLETIIQIARNIHAPVVAEGVETEEQMQSLKELGCDMVQGYYFSPPVPPREFERFLQDAKTDLAKREGAKPKSRESAAAKPKRKSIFKQWSEKLSIPLRQAGIVFVVIAIIMATGLSLADSMVTNGYQAMAEANERYIVAQQAATNLEIGSDNLTIGARSFVVTGDITYLQNYFTEAYETRLRDKAVQDLETMISTDSTAYGHLSTALSLSNELMNDEYLAMKLVLSTGDYDESLIPDVLQQTELSDQDAAMTPQEKRDKALDLVYGSRYAEYKAGIWNNADLCTEELIKTSSEERVRLNKRMDRLLGIQTMLTVGMVLVVLVIVVFIFVWVRTPLLRMVKHMRAKELAPPTGATELRFVSETYNAVFDENRRTQERLSYGNMHDALTGLYNRSAYDFMRHDLDMSKNALLLVDVDRFGDINDYYGQDVGDEVLKRVAEVLTHSFKSTDLVFRLGADEFVVIMANVDGSDKAKLQRTIDHANVMLQNPKGGLPPTSISVGAAFADRENPKGDIFKDADTALHLMKASGRCGCHIY